jgi:phosphate transport system protein
LLHCLGAAKLLETDLWQPLQQIGKLVVAEDEEIDILEKQVDQDGVNLLIRCHPVASDMREVVSAMKVSSNLERIADQSVSIARRAKHLNNRPAEP